MEACEKDSDRLSIAEIKSLRAMFSRELLLLLQCLLLQLWTVESFCETINLPDFGDVAVGKLLERHEIYCRT